MSAPHYNNNDYHYYNDNNYQQSPPPLPHHYETPSPDQYAMKNMSSPPPYPVYHQNSYSNDGLGPNPTNNRFSDQSRQSSSPYINHYDSDDEIEKIIPRERRKRSCMDKLCCGCCTCCPKWLRWCTCIIFIIIVILAIIIGVLVGIFKVPNVQFTGLRQDPQFSYSNNLLGIDFSVGITVDNQNFESITFETIKAEAYYPAPYHVFIGGGNITNTHISSFAVTNITFPFDIQLNSSDPKQQGVLMDLVTRCGLDGSTPQNINFNYYIYPTVRIAGIAITPKISKSMSLACPTSELSGLLSGLFGGH